MLAGRSAIITGAARGLGLGIARAFVAAGAAVVLLDRDPSVVATAAALGHSGEAFGLVCDVSGEEEVRDAVARIRDAGRRIDVLVNNAGMAPTQPFADMTVDQWQRVIANDLTSTFLCCREVVPDMISQGGGRIVNIGSQLGLAGAAEMVHYCAAKAAVHGFSKALARELAPHGILVNVVAPGPVETPGLAFASDDVLAEIRSEVPLGRFATVDEIAPTVVLLASTAGSFYTGSIVNVSGGHVIV